MTEQMDLYLGVAVTFMFLCGSFVIVLSAREQLEKRRRQRSWCSAKPPHPRNASHYEHNNKSRAHSRVSNRCSWPDLMRGIRAGLIHIEYGFAADGTLDYLKVWSSLTRGHWLLACEYWMSANNFHSAGISFENEYRSEDLAHILEVAMQHQNSFVLPSNLGRQGLLQISTPTAEESAAATVVINVAFDRLNPKIDQPAVA